MNRTDPNEINRLMGRFMDLQEQWEAAPDAFHWEQLETLAKDGAHAYNEGGGPSFHALVLDGTIHSAFHERFLSYLLREGFDPFRLVKTTSATILMPVISHDGLAQAALSNMSSARMRVSLLEVAARKFEPLVQAARAGALKASDPRLTVVQMCPESIPLEILGEIAPELAKSHPAIAPVDATEGYMSVAEAIIDRNAEPLG